MDDSIISGDMKESFSAINTLVRALDTTIQLNNVIKIKLLNEKNDFTHNQMKVIYENLDLLDDNSLILTQAIQTIKSLLTEIRNLREFQSYQINSMNCVLRENEIICDNENFKRDNQIFFENEILNRYDCKTDVCSNKKSNCDSNKIGENFRNSNYYIKNKTLNNDDKDFIGLNYIYNQKNQDDLKKRYYNSEANQNLTGKIKEGSSIDIIKIKTNTHEKHKDNQICLEKKPLRHFLLANKGKSNESKDLDQFPDKNSSNLKEISNFNNSQNLPSYQCNYDIKIEKHISIDKIKLSNEIMKNIEITEKYSDYFCHKYSFKEKSLKKFLENIIEYRYEKKDLIEILNDIMLIKNVNGDSDKLICGNTYYKTKESEDRISNYNVGAYQNFLNLQADFPLYCENNYQSKDHIINCNSQNIKKNNSRNTGYKNILPNNYNSKNIDNDQIKTSRRVKKKRYDSKQKRSDNHSFNEENNKTFHNSMKYSNPNFEKLLRNDYEKNHSKENNKKPFIRFTKVYGNFFDKDLLKKNSHHLPTEVNILNTSEK